jgi:hypothetical protein
MSNTDSKIIIECSINYILNNEQGQEISKGEALARLEAESFSVLPKFGEVLFLSLRDIITVSASDYLIHFLLTSKEKLTISMLGSKYEDFLRNFYKSYNELCLKDLLIQETLLKSGVMAEYGYIGENGQELPKGFCELRLYETAIAVIPECDAIIRIPYSTILEVKPMDYSLTVSTEYGENFSFSKLGREFDPFTKAFSAQINELSFKVQSLLKELVPEADPSVIRRAARFLKDGKATRKSDIESISPEFWLALERQLKIFGIRDEYDFLKSMSQSQKICLGFKQGLMGDLTGEYFWFLIPIYSTNPNEPGNVIAMEAVSRDSQTSENTLSACETKNEHTPGPAKATYFFRIVSRGNYGEFKNLEDLHRATDEAIKTINRGMLAINFRREPIYLSNEKLEEPQYQKYKFAISQLPALQMLRQLYIGRVIHSNLEQWQQDVMNLLEFNVSTQDDYTKWLKGEIENQVFD